MEDIPAHALLREALAFLNDRPNFGLRNEPHATSYRLAGRIEAYFARRVAAPGANIDRTRHLLGAVRWLRVDPPPASEADSWLPAWIFGPIEGGEGYRLVALEVAIAALPPMTREVFLAHRDRALDYPAIAAELGIYVAEVERHLATALVRLDEAVTAAELAAASRRDTGGNDTATV